MKYEPVKRYREHIMNLGIATEEKLNRIDAEQQAIVDVAFAQAVKADLPTPEDVIRPELVFAD